LPHHEIWATKALIRRSVNRVLQTFPSVNFAIEYYHHEQQVKNIIDAGLVTPDDWATHWFDANSRYHDLILKEVLNQSHFVSSKRLKYKWTYDLQSHYIDNPTYVILHENLQEEFNVFLSNFNISVKIPKLNATNSNKFLSEDNKKLLKTFYQEDMKLYEYYKNLPIKERLLQEVIAT